MQASLRRRWRRSYLYFIRYPSISSNSLSPTKDTLAQVYSEKHRQSTLWGHATRDPLQGLARGLAPFDPHPGGRGKEHHGRAAGSLGEDPSQRGGAGRVARQGPLR